MYQVSNNQTLKLGVNSQDTYILTLIARQLCLYEHARVSNGTRKKRAERLRNRTLNKITAMLLDNAGHLLATSKFTWEFRTRHGASTQRFCNLRMHSAYAEVCDYDWFFVITLDLVAQNYKRKDIKGILQSWITSVKVDKGNADIDYVVDKHDTRRLVEDFGIKVVDTDDD